LEAVDVLVTPTVANTPPRLDAIATTESYKPANLLCLRNTCVVSYLGLCALTLPCGRDAAGMPVGLQLVAGPHQEERLLAVARAIEAKLGSAAERLGAPPL
ncbi:MAG TPA: amidase family protein, partial [Polyangiaceae bacterium LLY-WYZ-15_(1-7)]|nr:amidase family protein [Polyangiaceae bacterium LLY-WYZ-15_(1-7)]